MTKPVDIQSLQSLTSLRMEERAILQRLFEAIMARTTDAQMKQDAIGLGDPTVSNVVGKLGARYVTVTAKTTESGWAPTPYAHHADQEAIYYLDSSVLDTSGNGYDGDMYNPGSVGDGYGNSMPNCNQCFYREQDTNDDNVAVVDGLSAGELDGFTNFTAECYFRMYKTPPSASGMLMHKSGTGTNWGTGRPFYIRVINATTAGSAQVQATVNYDDNGTNLQLHVDCITPGLFSASGPFDESGKWYHVAFSVESGGYKIQLAGYSRIVNDSTLLTKRDTTLYISTDVAPVMQSNANPFSVGARIQGSGYPSTPGDVTGHFYGLVDNVRILSSNIYTYTGSTYAIETSAVAQKVAHGLGRVPAVVLFLGEGDGVWRFDSSGGSSYKVVKRDDTYLHLRFDEDMVGKTLTFMVW